MESSKLAGSSSSSPDGGARDRSVETLVSKGKSHLNLGLETISFSHSSGVTVAGTTSLFELVIASEVSTVSPT